VGHRTFVEKAAQVRGVAAVDAHHDHRRCGQRYAVPFTSMVGLLLAM
jgi:hypothetical protein